MPDRSAYNDSTLVIGLGRFGSAVAATSRISHKVEFP